MPAQALALQKTKRNMQNECRFRSTYSVKKAHAIETCTDLGFFVVACVFPCVRREMNLYQALQLVWQEGSSMPKTNFDSKIQDLCVREEFAGNLRILGVYRMHRSLYAHKENMEPRA
jgi:hypothetical protein